MTAGLSATALFSLIAALTLSTPAPTTTAAAASRPVAVATPSTAAAIRPAAHRGSGLTATPVATSAAPPAATRVRPASSRHRARRGGADARPAPVTTTKTS